MRAVLISDTHNRHTEIDLPEAEMIIHAGDATGRGTSQEIAKFVEWFTGLKYNVKILIAGNHDFLYQDDPYLAKALVSNKGIHYLQDDCAQIGPHLIYGSPWQPWFYDWAFNLERGPEIAKKWEKIPDETSILVTHGPPKSILDRTKEGDLVGCYDLLDRVKVVKPKLHVFGHIHEGYGTHRSGDTLFVNASTCTREYVPSNKPIVVESDDEGNWFVVSD